MKRLGALFVIIGIALTCGAVAGISNRDFWKVHTTLTSYDLHAIERALPELRRRRPDWSQYQISVAETETSLIVSFWRKEDANSITITRPQSDGAPEEIVGSIPRDYNEFVVTLDKRNLRITSVANVGK
jgi:hypothetical protein